MYLWQIWLVTGIIIFIVDLFITTTFFINLALGFFIAALCAYLGTNIYVQLISFFVTSALFLLFLRPLLLQMFKVHETHELDSKYINKQAKVIEPITETSGRISVYGEEWSAKSGDGTAIDLNSNVKIVKQENMIMVVEKI